MDINALINEATSKIIEERMPLMVEEKVAKMMDGILDNIFKTYSDTGKSIQKKIEESLQVNLKKFDLIDYAGLVANHVNTQLVKEVNLQHITNLIRETVGVVNAEEMKLSEIIDWFIQASQEDNSTEGEGEISLHLEYSEKYKWTEVYIDSEEGKLKEDCEVSFLISGKSGSIFSVRLGSYWWKGQHPVTAMQFSQMSTLAHRVFRLYAASVKVIVDIDSSDVSHYSEWDRY